MSIFKKCFIFIEVDRYEKEMNCIKMKKPNSTKKVNKEKCHFSQKIIKLFYYSEQKFQCCCIRYKNLQFPKVRPFTLMLLKY